MAAMYTETSMLAAFSLGYYPLLVIVLHCSLKELLQPEVVVQSSDCVDDINSDRRLSENLRHKRKTIHKTSMFAVTCEQ